MLALAVASSVRVLAEKRPSRIVTHLGYSENFFENWFGIGISLALVFVEVVMVILTPVVVLAVITTVAEVLCDRAIAVRLGLSLEFRFAQLLGSPAGLEFLLSVSDLLRFFVLKGD